MERTSHESDGHGHSWCRCPPPHHGIDNLDTRNNGVRGLKIVPSIMHNMASFVIGTNLHAPVSYDQSGSVCAPTTVRAQ